MSTSQYIRDRKLPERSFLKFYFPIPEGNNSGYYTVQLPFFENVEIKERKRADYQKHSLISRSSNLYTYTGAESRKLSLNFNMSLDHIMSHPELTWDKYVVNTAVQSREQEIAKFKNPDGVESPLASVGAAYTANFLASFLPEDQEEGDVIADVNAQLVAGGELGYPKNKFVDLIVFWLNVVRSSCSNNATSPIYGPPLIRIHHGVLYQDIPCICTDFSISINEAAGHDLNTLLPRQIQVAMSLEEFRNGDGGEFNPTGSVVERDNLAGWEAVISKKTHSMDPAILPGRMHKDLF